MTRKRLPHLIYRRNRGYTFSAILVPALLATLLVIVAAANRSESETLGLVGKNDLRLLPLAKGYLDKGDAVAAQNLLETYLELYPSDAEAHFYLGQAYASEKNYAPARLEFSRCLKEKDRVELSAEANKQLLKLPDRVLRPRELGSLALKEANPKECLIVFFANWDGNSVKLKNLAESMSAKSNELTIRTLEASDPNAAAIFDLYSVSAVPTVVVLSGRTQHMIASMVGPISEERLRNLIAYHSAKR